MEGHIGCYELGNSHWAGILNVVKHKIEIKPGELTQP
jgi:hypothetical protein